MPLRLPDGASPDSYRRGDQALDAVYSGDEKLWPLPITQGMTKSGIQSLANSSVFLRVTGWTPDVGSTVTGDALVVRVPGAYVLWAEVAWVNNAANRQCRVTRNGVVVVTSPVGTSAASLSLTVAAGDLLTLEAQTTSTLANNRRIAESGTYLGIVPA